MEKAGRDCEAEKRENCYQVEAKGIEWALGGVRKVTWNVRAG